MPQATLDLVGIFTRVSLDSPQNAAVLVRRLVAAADSLASLPHRFKVYRSSSTPSRVVHSMPVSPYAIYYKVRERAATVEI